MAGFFALPGSDVEAVDLDELLAKYHMEEALDEGDLGDMVLESELA